MGFKGKHLAAAMLLVVMSIAGTGLATAAEDVPRMTVDELLAVIDSPDVAVVDVRQPWDFKKTQGMIKNAVVRDNKKVGQWQAEYDKGKTIVLYCA